MSKQLLDNLNEIKNQKDTYLLPENLKKDVTVLGITGTMETGIDTSDATATANDILSPKTAYINNGKVEGKITSNYEIINNDFTTKSYNIDYATICDVNIEHNLFIDIGKQHSGNTLSIYGYNDNMTSITKKQTLTYTDLGITEDVLINSAAFSQVLNINGNLYIIMHANTGTSSTYYFIIIEYDYVNNKIIKIKTNTFNRTGGDQYYVYIAPNPVNALEFISIQNTSVNAPIGIDVCNIASDLTVTEPQYIIVGGTKQGTADWANDGNKFLLKWNYDNNGGARLYVRNGSASSFSSKMDLVGTCGWLTSDILFHGNSLMNVSGSYVKSSLDIPTLNGTIKNVTDGCVALFNMSTGIVHKLILDLSDYSVIQTEQIGTCKAWNNNNYNTLIHPRQKVGYSLSMNNTLNIYQKNVGEKLISFSRNDILYANTSDADVIAENILKGKIAYGKDGKIIGTLEVGLTPEEYDRCDTLADNILSNDSKPYTELKYIQSDGTQWIDTEYVPNENTKYEIDLSDITGPEGAVVFGTDEYNSNRDLLCVQSSPLELRWYYPSGRFITVTNNAIAKCKITCYRGSVTYNDTVVSNSTAVHSTVNTSNLYLLRCTGSNTYAACKIYSFKVYESNKLVRDFVPALDLVGTVCMYDKITKKCYYSGTATKFVAGGVV